MKLRPVSVADASTAYRWIHGRVEILRWLLWGGPRSVRELEESFECWARARPSQGERMEYLFAIDEVETDTFVGTIGVLVQETPDAADIGYWLAEHVWSRGYATEAVRLASHFAFRHLEAQSVCAWVFVGNVASRRVLEKNGFTLVRTAYDKLERDGQKRDEWYFVLLRSEWERDPSGFEPVSEQVASEDSGIPTSGVEKRDE